MAGNADLVRRGYDALSRRDLAAIRALLHPEVVLATTVETFHGVDGVLEWLRRTDEALDDYTVEIEGIEEHDGTVVVHTYQRGSGRESGVSVDHRVTHVWTVRDGRLVALQASLPER